MEKVKGKKLKKFIQSKNKLEGKKLEEQVAKLIGSLLKSVEYMHSNHICHRDIKPANLILCECIIMN